MPSAEREQLIEQLTALLDRQGKAVVVAPGASESDLRWMLRYHSRAWDDWSARDYLAAGVGDRGIGGDRVQLGRNGIFVRPRR